MTSTFETSTSNLCIMEVGVMLLGHVCIKSRGLYCQWESCWCKMSCFNNGHVTGAFLYWRGGGGGGLVHAGEIWYDSLIFLMFSIRGW